MNCALEHRGLGQDGVVGKIGIGQDGIAVVQGYIRVADVVDRCAGDYNPCCRQGELLVHVF